MVKKLDKILVIDIESTCWEGNPPPGEESEIIEIGICLLEVSTRKRVGKECILVRPEKSKVSPFCTELTTLTQEQVDGGISFQEACSLLKKKFLSKERLWASFGDYDRRQFERVCAARKIGVPFGPGHLNVKTLFAVSRKLPHEAGLAGALDLAGLKLEGTHHRGVDDAWNIAALLSGLLEKGGSSW